jgi:hypothetical protein
MPVPECYRTEMLDAGIPMPAASASMPMPSYEQKQSRQSDQKNCNKKFKKPIVRSAF